MIRNLFVLTVLVAGGAKLPKEFDTSNRTVARVAQTVILVSAELMDHAADEIRDWVRANEPRPEPVAQPETDGLSQEEQLAKLLEELHRRQSGNSPTPPPAQPQNAEGATNSAPIDPAKVMELLEQKLQSQAQADAPISQ